MRGNVGLPRGCPPALLPAKKQRRPPGQRGNRESDGRADATLSLLEASESAPLDELSSRRVSSLGASSSSADLGWSRHDAVLSYASQLEEFEYDIDEVEGALPADLEGTYLRNGPGRFERDAGYEHPFDGDGYLQQLTVRRGRASVRTRYVRTAEFAAEEAAGKILYRNAFGTQRIGGPWANILDLKLKNVANTATVLWGGKLMALWEAAQPHVLDTRTLETLGLDTLNGFLRLGTPFSAGSRLLDWLLRPLGLGGEALCAHPHEDPRTGRLLAFKYQLVLAPRLRPKLKLASVRTRVTLAEHDAALRRVSERWVDLEGYPLLHDFAFTENYYVLVQNPVDIDALPFVMGEKGPAQCLVKSRGQPALVHLVPRRGGGDAVTVAASEQFSLHHANAFEDEHGRVVLDSVFMDDLFALGAGGVGAFVDSAGANQPYRLVRTTVDPAQRTCTRRTLSGRVMEFPKVSADRAGRRHRYIYAVGSRHPTRAQPPQLWVKVDADAEAPAAADTACDFGFSCYAGEPDFVPRSRNAADAAGAPGAQSEDDGWLVGFVFDARCGRTFFAVVDARTMRLEAAAWLRHALPQGLHGAFHAGVFLQEEEAGAAAAEESGGVRGGRAGGRTSSSSSSSSSTVGLAR